MSEKAGMDILGALNEGVGKAFVSEVLAMSEKSGGAMAMDLQREDTYGWVRANVDGIQQTVEETGGFEVEAVRAEKSQLKAWQFGVHPLRAHDPRGRSSFQPSIPSSLIAITRCYYSCMLYSLTKESHILLQFPLTLVGLPS
jgi:hypothetical protein